MAKVIITGGTGLIGKRLSRILISKGYDVNILCRNPKSAKEYKWDPEKMYIDEKVFDQATAIIHLAGAGVSDKRWTNTRKKEIIDSRVQSAQLLHQYLANHDHTVRNFISASAVGFYGDRKDELLTEESSGGHGFLADVCKQWEASAEKFASLGISVSILRIGIVLSKEGGALPKLDFPIKFGIGAYIGDGRQYVPWIHRDDLCSMFIFLLENSFAGVYNGCAPEIKTNKQMSETIAQVLHRPFIPVPAPGFILKTVLGELASILLMSTNCSSEKIIQKGFQFQFPTLAEALERIYNT